MQQRKASHSPRRNLDIRDLTSHPDDEREIGEVEVVGRVSAWKRETAGMFTNTRVIAIAVKNMSVAQSEN